MQSSQALTVAPHTYFTNISQDSLGHEHRFIQAQHKNTQLFFPQVSCRNRQQHNVLISALHPEGKTKVSCTQLYKFQSHCILQPLTSDQNEVLKYAEHSLCTGLIFPKIF